MKIKALDNIRRSIAGFINPDEAIRNKFNEAFFSFLGGGYTNYDTKNKTYLEKGYNINPIVYAVINQQATKTSTIPFYIKKVDNERAFKQRDKLYNSTKGAYTPQQWAKKVLLENKAFDKGDLDFPMVKPNVSQSWTEFLALYKTFLKLTGNVYIYSVAPEMGMNKGEPQQVYLLPSHLMQIVLKSNADLLSNESPIDHYILTEGNNYIKFMAEDVIHIKYSNPNFGLNGEHLYGQSPLRAALKNIQSSNTSLDLNIKTLQSGGAFGLIHGKNIAMTPEQAKELKSRLVEMDNDPTRLAKLAGVSTEIGFTRLSLTSDELKPFDYLKFDTKQICNVLGWDDKLLNSDEGAKYDNMGYARRRVVTDNIVPDLQLLSNALNEKWLPRFKGYEKAVIEFDVSELPEMQEDMAKLVEWVKESVNTGLISRNEGRIVMRFSSSENEDLDVFTVQSGTIPLEEALDTDFNIQ